MLQLLALLLALLRPPARAQEPAAQDVSLGVVSMESTCSWDFLVGWERAAGTGLVGQAGA